MEMHRVTSSQLESIGWENDTLRVAFLSGSTYEYANVRNSLFQEMLNARKPSAVFNAKIKSHPSDYPFTKL
tara:strand:- start:1600 stop:1812 length:213 start_codon:yes stop_codon:yes gene_type:complete